MKPVIIINMKTYNQGNKAINLIKKISEIDKNIIIGVQQTNIYQVSKLIKNPIYAEHVDFHNTGRNTGYILPEAVKAAGAIGVFLNHSEHRLDLTTIKKTVKRCQVLKLKIGIFAKDLNQAKELKKLKPDYLIIEPPELVAGKISVSKSRPELIAEIGKKLKYPFIVGAGIKTFEDLKIAVKLGATGIAISSAITTAKNPKKILKELIN